MNRITRRAGALTSFAMLLGLAATQALAAGTPYTGTPYAVAPGTLKNRSGEPFQVFTPFHRAWLDHGVGEPAPGIHARTVTWLRADGPRRLESPDEDLGSLAGEKPARKAWHAWLRRDSEGVTDYVAFASRVGPSVRLGEGEGIVASWTTDAPHGFADAEIALITSGNGVPNTGMILRG